GAARSAFPDDHRDERNPEPQTAIGRARYRLRLSAFLRIDAGIGAGGIDEGENRDPEAVGGLHETHRLAVAFRTRHAEIMLEPCLRIMALLLTDDGNGLAAKPAKTADNGIILAELAVACHRRVIGDERTDIIRTMWPVGMARH